MPSSMGSSSNLFYHLLRNVFPVVIATLLFAGCQQVEKDKPTEIPASDIQQLLDRADSATGLSPDLAGRVAQQAQDLAITRHSDLHLTRAWITMGRIHSMKAHHDTAMLYYGKALELAAQKGFDTEMCKASIAKGEVFYRNGKYDMAFNWFKKADSLAAAKKLEQVDAQALFYIGKYHQTKGHFAAAKNCYLRAMAIGRKYKDNTLILLVLPSLGKNYISEGNLQQALSCYQEGYYLSAGINNGLLSADICNHLGSLYLRLKEFDKAMYYHRKALDYRLAINYPDGLAKSYNNIGLVFYEKKQPDSAGYYFNKSLAICRDIRYKKGTIKALDNLGKVYLEKHKPAEASRYFSEAYGQALAAGYDVGIAESSLDLGNLYRQSGQPEKAIDHYLISLNTLQNTGFNETLLDAYRGLYECYTIKKEYKSALDCHIKMLELEKKLLDVENQRQLGILTMTFDTERKEKDYQVLVKENELKASLLKKNTIALWLVAAVLSFTILLCLYIYNRFYLKKKANRQLEDLNAKITQQNTELEHLNRELGQVSREKDKLFSIISHELRNPLYWLQNLSEVLSRKYQSMTPEKIRKSLTSLDESAKNVYHLMDNLLHWSRSKLNRIHPDKDAHPLHQLVSETTQMYDSFLKQKEISFHNKIPTDVSIFADADLFSCVIRNLLSNAIKYTPNEGEIYIDCELTADTAIIHVADSGKGMKSSDLENAFASDATISIPGLMQEKGSGLGLKLCRDFVEINGGKIWAISEPDQGTHVFFTVPLHTSTLLANQAKTKLAIDLRQE